jgi:phenolic acid decarboxylase
MIWVDRPKVSKYEPYICVFNARRSRDVRMKAQRTEDENYPQTWVLRFADISYLISHILVDVEA